MEYKNFECDYVDNVDFVIDISNFSPNLAGCRIIDNTYYIKEDYFFCDYSYKFGKCKIEIKGLDFGQISIRISTNFIANQFAAMFICAHIIDFFIRFCLNEKGYSVIHSSSVGKDGIGYLFPSQSGAGKTTTAIYFANSDYDYLGDDFTILKDGILYNYITPLNLFSYNLNPLILREMGFYDKFLIKFNDLIFHLSSGYVKIFSKMNPILLFNENIGNKIPLKKVLLLSQQKELSTIKINKEAVVNNIIINQKIESFPFFKYLLEYSYIFPNSRIASYWDRCLHDINRNLVDGIEYFEVGIPMKYDESVFRFIRDVVEDRP